MDFHYGCWSLIACRMYLSNRCGNGLEIVWGKVVAESQNGSVYGLHYNVAGRARLYSFQRTSHEPEEDIRAKDYR